MIRWEWEGTGNKKVVPAHLYSSISMLCVSRSQASDVDVCLSVVDVLQRYQMYGRLGGAGHRDGGGRGHCGGHMVVGWLWWWVVVMVVVSHGGGGHDGGSWSLWWSLWWSVLWWSWWWIVVTVVVTVVVSHCGGGHDGGGATSAEAQRSFMMMMRSLCE